MKILVSGCSNSSQRPFIFVRNQHNAPIYPIKLSNQLGCSLDNISAGGKCNNRIFNDTIIYLTKCDNLPDIIIVQWTEFDRKSFFIPQIQRWIKGLPSSTTLSTSITIKNHRKNQIWTEIGDPSIDQEQVLIKIIALQAICRIKNIPIYFINWFPFDSVKNNILWKQIDTSNFLIENPCDGGMAQSLKLE
jgi:hypothetical protein